MTPERLKIEIRENDIENDTVWDHITTTFFGNPEAVQQIILADGPLAGRGFTMSMHCEEDGSGYFQVENVTIFTLETIFMNWCLENGEVLPVGIYRFPFSPLDFSKNP